MQAIQDLAPGDVEAALSKLPRDVSPDCVALLRRIFSIAPATRPALADIMADPWCAAGWHRGLPPCGPVRGACPPLPAPTGDTPNRPGHPLPTLHVPTPHPSPPLAPAQPCTQVPPVPARPVQAGGGAAARAAGRGGDHAHPGRRRPPEPAAPADAGRVRRRGGPCWVAGRARGAGCGPPAGREGGKPRRPGRAGQAGAGSRGRPARGPRPATPCSRPRLLLPLAPTTPTPPTTPAPARPRPSHAQLMDDELDAGMDELEGAR